MTPDARGLQPPGVTRAILSTIEHPSVVGATEHLEKLGAHLSRLPVTTNGVVRVDQLKALITPDTRLVSVMAGNNETGVLQPVREVAAVCRAAGVPLHTDAVQLAGKVPVEFRAWDVSAMTIAAHKFHGPVGIGALVVCHGVELAPQLHGGFQQAGLRPGTEPVALIVGFRAALELWHQNQAAIFAQLTSLRDRFEGALLTAAPELVINGARAPRLPHTSNVAFPGLDRQALLMALDLAGVACSTGSACASGSSEPSPTLVAMGLERSLVEGSLRFSFGRENTPAEVDESVRRILLAYNDLRAKNKARKMPAAARETGHTPV